MSIFINDVSIMLYKKKISNVSKYLIITSIIFFGFLKGYTGNDLVTNMYECFKREKSYTF
jgi:hypothetical protein